MIPGEKQESIRNFGFITPDLNLKLLELDVPKTNYIKNIVQRRQLITSNYLDTIECIPRPPLVTLAGRQNLNTPWDFAKSIFKPYRADNPKLLEECFEIDWDTIEYKLSKLMLKKYG